MATKNVNFFKYGTDASSTGGSGTISGDKGNGPVTADTLRVVNATDDPNLTQIETDLSNIETEITSADAHLATIDTDTHTNLPQINSKLTTTNTRLSTIATETTSSDAHLAVIESETTSADAHLAVIQNTTTSSDGKLTTIANEVTSSDAHLATIESEITSADSHLSNIETSNANLTNWNSGNTCKVTIAGNTPATSPVYNANITAVESTIISSLQVDSFSTFFVWITNTGAAALTEVTVYASATGGVGTWVSLHALQDSEIEAACRTLGAGLPGIAFMAIGPQAFKYIKVTATTGTATTVACYVTAKY